LALKDSIQPTDGKAYAQLVSAMRLLKKLMFHKCNSVSWYNLFSFDSNESKYYPKRFFVTLFWYRAL